MLHITDINGKGLKSFSIHTTVSPRKRNRNEQDQHHNNTIRDSMDKEHKQFKKRM